MDILSVDFELPRLIGDSPPAAAAQPPSGPFSPRFLLLVREVVGHRFIHKAIEHVHNIV
jgi:hypothetical protein